MKALAFDFPLALGFIPLAWALLVLLSRTSATGFSSSHARRILVLRGLVMTFLLGALAIPNLSTTTNARHILWAVDASQSVGRAGWETARALISQTSLPKSQQSLLAFAREAVPVETIPQEGPPGVGPEGTNLAQAVQFAEASFPPGRRRLLALVTDGRENEGSLEAVLPALKAAGVVVAPIPVQPPEEPDAILSAMRLPAEARVGEPFSVEVTIASTRPGPATLEIREDGLLAATLPVQLQKGENRISLAQRFSRPGVVHLSMTVRIPGDLHPENDSLVRPLQIHGPPRVLIVNESGASPLADALRHQDILSEVRPGRGVPDTVSDLAAFDVIVIEDVPAADWKAQQVQALVSAVKDWGTGLLMLGGPHAFGPGGYAEGPIEEILPVRSELEQQREDPSVALVLVMDRSGSMAGEKMRMAASAAVAAIGRLSSQDLVGVVAFDNEAHWVAELQSAANASAITGKIAGLAPGGGTRITAGLELAWERLRRAPAQIRHVILLSDGVSSPGPFPEVAARLAADRITLSSVGVGPDADTQLLAQLARWGRGRHYQAATAEALPQIFVRETLLAARPALRELPVAAIPARADGLLAGLDFMDAPTLLGYVDVLLKPGATLWLATGTGDPLLATWRIGLGTTAAFTSDARDVWASDWVAWSGFGKFWAQILRGLMRPAELRSFPVTILRERDGFRVSVDVSGERPLQEPGGRLTALGPNGILRSAILEHGAPGYLSAWIPASEEGPWLLQAAVTSLGQVVSTLTRGESVDTRIETLPGPLNRQLLEKAAGQTGGIVNPRDLATLPLPPQSARRDLWPLLLLFGLTTFLGDVAARRIPRVFRNRTLPQPEA